MCRSKAVDEAQYPCNKKSKALIQVVDGKVSGSVFKKATYVVAGE
ncbi:hypothetical protein [Ideonella sp.]